jgi:hypothetical protein
VGLAAYQDYPDLRPVTLWHIPFYWTQSPSLLGWSEEEIAGMPDYPYLEWSDREPILERLQAELRRQHSVDVVFLVREY